MQRNGKLTKWISELVSCFKPINRVSAIISIISSFFMVFAFFIVVSPQWYAKTPKYTELITGLTAFSGYNKEVDMLIVKILLIAVPVLFLCLNALFRFCIKELAMDREAAVFFLSGGIVFLILVMNGNSNAYSLIWGLGIAFSAYIILKIKNLVTTENIRLFGYNAFILYIVTQSISIAMCSVLKGSILSDVIAAETGYLLVGVLAGIMVCLYAIWYRIKKFDLLRHRDALQIGLPIGLLGLVYFQYDYETTGEVFTLFYSSRYKYFVYGLAFLFVANAVYGFVKRKNTIYVTSLVTIAAMRAFVKPEGVLNIDFFHMGEMSTPFQQLESYGKIPFFEIMPIHGLCDYYYSFVNRVFLDGTYLSLNAAMTIGNLLLAGFLAVVLYKTCKNQELALLFTYFFIPFMINGAGIRYIFMFVMFFVLFSEKVRGDCMKYVWWYVFLAILSITWNVSIGGAGAAAFFLCFLIIYVRKLPAKLILLFREGAPKEKKRFICAYSLLFLMGIAFIPVFLKVVIYLKENAGTTLMTNGMAMVEDLERYQDYFTPNLFINGQVSFLHIFGFMIPFMICLVMAVVSRDKLLQRTGMEFSVILFVCFYIIANYAFVRFDSGLRTGVISTFFFMLILFSILYEGCYTREHVWGKSGFIFMFFATILMTGDSVLIDTENIVENKKVESYAQTTIMGQNVDDPIVYVTGDSVSMKYLGNGFVRGNTLKNLQNIQYVLHSELGDNKEYLDMTNAVANYVFMDYAMVMPYTSGYNISNEEMQQKAVGILEEKQTELVLLAPYIRFDEATISLRSPKLYEYFLDAGYEPYVYENVIYMKKGSSHLFGESNGWEAFAQLMHKEALQMLPTVWGNSDLQNRLQTVEVLGETARDEESITYTFEQQLSGQEIDFIQIHLPEVPLDADDSAINELQSEVAEGDINQDQVELFLQFDHDKEYGFSFYVQGDTLLLPVFSSPYWKEIEELASFKISVKEGDKEILERLSESDIVYYQYK